VLLAGGVGVGFAAARTGGDAPGAPGAMAVASKPAAHRGGRADTARRAHPAAAVDPAKQAWARQYGVDRSSMPDLAPVAGATPAQRDAATDLLVRTEAATAGYADPAVAANAGFDLRAGLARREKRFPGLAAKLHSVDTGTPPAGGMPMLHVSNKANRADGKVLDPTAPETLMYGYQGHDRWTLMGVMYTANETYPQAPPDPGGPITRWHYHDKSGERSLMMHLFFVPGNDLAHAYAADMKS
jgi:hypothetical protein